MVPFPGNVAAAEGTSQRAGKETNGGADHAQTWASGSGGSLLGGSAGGNGAAGGSANGIDRAGSAGLPITPLRLDSGLQVGAPFPHKGGHFFQGNRGNSTGLEQHRDTKLKDNNGGRSMRCRWCSCPA